MPKEPGCFRHKPSRKAIVRLGGKMFYLGPFGSVESHENYARLKSEWLSSRHSPKFEPPSLAGPTVA